MIISTGIDLVETERILASLKNPRFLTRVFNQAEIDMFKTKNFSINTIAANFAAKEAFSKAMGTGVVGFGLSEVALLRNELGKPYFKFYGKAKTIAQGYSFSVSVTHTKCYASCVVVAYSL